MNESLACDVVWVCMSTEERVTRGWGFSPKSLSHGSPEGLEKGQHMLIFIFPSGYTMGPACQGSDECKIIPILRELMVVKSSCHGSVVSESDEEP